LYSVKVLFVFRAVCVFLGEQQSCIKCSSYNIKCKLIL